MSLDPRQVIITPVVSEKSYSLIEDNKYSFRVHPKAHKTQIRQAVEELFDVKVVGRQRPQGAAEAEAPRLDARDEAGLEEGDRPAPRRRQDRDLRGGRGLVARLATFGGARRAITLRHAASSVAPGLSSPSAPCVLVWLGARTPGIHQCHEASH